MWDHKNHSRHLQCGGKGLSFAFRLEYWWKQRTSYRCPKPRLLRNQRILGFRIEFCFPSPRFANAYFHDEVAVSKAAGRLLNCRIGEATPCQALSRRVTVCRQCRSCVSGSLKHYISNRWSTESIFVGSPVPGSILKETLCVDGLLVPKRRQTISLMIQLAA